MSVVDIAMATYNGEKYLKEQIDSIISQSFTDWRLFIRDDASTDNTVNIIRQYIKKDPRIHLIEDNLGNLRVSRNFEQALSNCSAPYTMFADQDDVWFDNKIAASISYMNKIEKDDPVLVFSNSILTSENLEKKYGYNYNLTKPPHLKNFLFCNAGYQGSAIIINEKLKQKLLFFFPNSPVHDYHVSIAGLLLGKVYHISTPLMIYRRHDTATTKQNLTIKDRFIYFLKNKSLLYDEKMLNYLKTFILYHENEISDNNKKLLNDYFQINDKNISLLKKIKLVLKNKFVLRGSSYYLILKISLLK
jgi:rhamnosyltransferase